MIIDTLKSSGFTPIEKTIASYFLAHPDQLASSSTRDIARELFISASAVTRFCQKIGFAGYNDFRKAYLNEQKYLNTHFTDIDPNRPFEKNDSDYTVAGKISHLYQLAVEDTCDQISWEVLEKCVRMLDHAALIRIVSAGTHIDLAYPFREKMTRIGKNVIMSRHPDIAFSAAVNADQNEIFILISYSGESEGIVRTAARLHERHIPSIAITSFGNNRLSSYADCTLYLCTRERLNSSIGNYCSYVSVMYLLDVLYSCLFKHGYDENLQKKYEIAREYHDHRTSDNPLLKDED